MASKAAERKFSSPARLPSADNLKIDSDSDSDEDDKVLTGQTWADFTKEEEIPDKKIGDYVIQYYFICFEIFLIFNHKKKILNS